MYSTRKVTDYSFSGSRYRFPSMKNGEVMLCESYIECCNLLLLEFDTRVEKYQVQPVTFSYPHQEKIRKYTPDVLVQYKDESLACQEVKYEKVLDDKDMQSRFFQIRNCLSKYNVTIEIVTEKEVFKEPRHSNLKRLYTYLSTDNKHEEHIVDLVRNGVSSLGSLTSKLNTNEEIEAVYSLMHKGGLEWNIDKPISESTKLSVRSGKLCI